MFIFVKYIKHICINITIRYIFKIYKVVDFLVKYFAKGDPIVVDGRLQSRNWTDKDGNKRYTVEIIAENLYFGSAKKSSVGNDAASTPTQQNTPAQQEDDGELPF